MSSPLEVVLLLTIMGDQEVKQKMEDMAKKTGELADRTEKAADKAEELEVGYAAAAEGISDAATKAFALYSQYDNLEKVQLRVATAEKNIDSARAALMSSQARLAELVNDGVTSGTEYEQALIRVEAAEQKLLIAQKKSEQAQEDVNQSYISFALSIMPAAKSVLDGFTQAKNALAGATWAHFLSTVQNSLGLAGNTAAKSVNTGATITATGATHGLTLATRLLQLAMGPVGWALLGIGAVMGLVATNTFGLRDAFADFFGALPEATTSTEGARAAVDSMGTSVTGARDKAAEAERGITNDFSSLSSNVGSSVDAAKTAMAGLQTSFSDTSTSASSNMANLAASTATHADSIVSAAQRAEDALKRLGGLPATVQLPNANLPFGAQAQALQAQMITPDQAAEFKSFLDSYAGRKQALLDERQRLQDTVINTPGIGTLAPSTLARARARLLEIEGQLAGLIDRKNYAEQQLALRDYLMTQLPPATQGDTVGFKDSITVELKLSEQTLERVTTEVDRRLARRR
ncbi:hypothetical protein [Nitrososphaera sp.]|uniref:hypothetical protein n=1 Tax=Nitrososphaera sp. TaxID=1971748 RepID=UPI00307E5DE4